MNRQQTIIRIGDLQEQHCGSCERKKDWGNLNFEKHCAGCGVYSELRKLGDRLLATSAERRKDPNREEHKLLAKGEMLTWKDVDRLIELEVSRKEISKAVGLSEGEFYRQLKERDKNKGVENVAVTADRVDAEKYMELKRVGLDEKEAAKELKISGAVLWEWKKHLPESYKKELKEISQAKRLKTLSEARVARAAERVETNDEGETTQKEDKPIKTQNEPSDEVKEQLKKIIEENKQLHKEKQVLEEWHTELKLANSALRGKLDEIEEKMQTPAITEDDYRLMEKRLYEAEQMIHEQKEKLIEAESDVMKSNLLVYDYERLRLGAEQAEHKLNELEKERSESKKEAEELKRSSALRDEAHQKLYAENQHLKGLVVLWA